MKAHWSPAAVDDLEAALIILSSTLIALKLLNDSIKRY